MVQAQKKEAALFDILITTMGMLTELMEEENQLLAKQDVEGLKLVHERKTPLVSRYSTGMKEIALNPALLRTAPPDVRAALKSQGEKLAKASEKNAIALKGAVEGTKKLLQTVISMVRQEKTTMFSYTNLKPNGFKSMRATTESPCEPAACNRTV